MIYDIHGNLIATESTANRIVVDEFGLKGDGVTDNLELFNELYESYSSSTFVFRNGIYCFSGTLSLTSTHLYIENSTIKFTSACTYGIHAKGTQDDEHEHPEASEFITGHGGVIDCNNNAKIGIAAGTGKMFEIGNLRICNVPTSGTGLYHGVAVGAGMCYELNAHDLLIENYDILDNTVGIRMESDSLYSNIVTTNMKIGVLVEGGLNMLRGYHPWNYDFQHLSGNRLGGTVGVKLNSSILTLSDCYLDSVETGVLTTSSSNILMASNIYNFCNTGGGTFSKTPVILSGFGTGATVKLTNGRINPAITTHFSESAFTACSIVGCSYNSHVDNTPLITVNWDVVGGDY